MAETDLHLYQTTRVVIGAFYYVFNRLCVKSCGIAPLSDRGMAVGKSQERVETPCACGPTDGC